MSSILFVLFSQWCKSGQACVIQEADKGGETYNDILWMYTHTRMVSQQWLSIQNKAAYTLSQDQVQMDLVLFWISQCVN